MTYAINAIRIDGDSQLCAAGYAAQSGWEPEEYDQIPVSTSIACLIEIQKVQWSWMMNHIGRGEKKNRAGDVIKPEERAQDWLKDGKLLIGMSADDGTNFRNEVATVQVYKGNRKPDSKPVHYQQLREWMIKTWNPVLVSGRETDDWCGEQMALSPQTTMCLHLDKDINQCPGWHTWYESKALHNRRPYYVEPDGYMYLERSNSGSLEVHATGLYMLAYQMLKGDSVDNIPGVKKGFGPEKIYDYLRGVNHKLLMPKVYEKYIEEHGSDEGHRRYHEIYKLVRILGGEENNHV